MVEIIVPRFLSSASLRACLSFTSSLSLFNSCMKYDKFKKGFSSRTQLNFPAFRRICSLAFASFASSSAFLERFSAIFSRNSAKRCFFSSSVSGLIYWHEKMRSIGRVRKQTIYDLFSRFLELIVAALLRMEISQCGILEDLTTLGTFDTLTRRSVHH